MRRDEIPAWQRIFARRKKRLPREVNHSSLEKNVEIAGFWQCLSRERPVAILQGYPGMGKSTFMKRLTLHMARRCLGMSDSLLPVDSPVLVPLLIELKKYADALKKARKNKTELPFSTYFPQMLQKRSWQGKDPWPSISSSLEHGTCLVLFDGLDEVGNVEVRKQVAGEINTFILEQRNTLPEKKKFNRFIVTSRVAGYSPEAFPNASPYRIAELTDERMHQLLTLWYRAVLKAEPGAQDAETRMQRLHSAIDEKGPIFRLAENPLLLMLMAAMQKYGINLPRERAELYDTVTLTLLKYREVGKDLSTIDEDEAVRRLGPLAYAMQTTDYIADEQAVMDSLRKTFREERTKTSTALTVVSDPEIDKQVLTFLTLIRERSNLFVQRTGENFSFFHKSFQEYFAARFLLNAIQRRRDVEIPQFVELARQTGDIWREPFLFAVGYQSVGRGRDQTVARDLLQRLLDACEQESDPTRRLHDLLLAADALVEAKALTFDETQEQQIAQDLLPFYMEAQYQEKFGDCQRIEHAIKLWLLALPSGESQSPLLTVLCTILQNLQRVDLQRAILTLLVMILSAEEYPQLVYKTLLSHLLGLTDLPALNQDYQPVPHTGVVDYAVADLALVALSRMGHRGPSGLLLDSIRQYFEQEPEQLRLLARYSLESQMPLILGVIALPGSLSQRRAKALERWSSVKKRREQRARRPINEDLPECLAIQQELLDCAEEVCYPASLHLLAMLKASHTHPDQIWQDVWQAYMLQQVAILNPYVYYQEIVLLWESLFPGDRNLRRITEHLSANYTQGKEPYNRFSQRFLSTLSEDLRDWRDWRDWRYLRDWRDWRYLRGLIDLIDLRGLIDFRYLIYWRDTFLVAITAKQAIQSLSIADEMEAIDLCAILLGRMLQIQEAHECGQVVVEETQHIVDSIMLTFVKTGSRQKELRASLLDILRYLPARSSEEITFVCHLVESSGDKEIQQALAHSLSVASPDKDALPILQAATSSTNVLVARAAQEALAREQRQ